MHLTSIEKQGQMMRNTSSDAASLWAKATHSLPPEQSKFSPNAAVDNLLHYANLHLWKKGHLFVPRMENSKLSSMCSTAAV